MQISFNPAVGEAVNILTPQLLQGTHMTPLLFTAQLSATDYNLMASKGGRVQLWSNLPHDGERNDAWQEFDFTDTCGSERRSSDSNIIQLGDNVLPENHQIKHLHLLIFFSSMTSGTQYFSFTYRIGYASGEVTWFGAFGQNGIVSLLPSSSDFLGGLVLEEKWGLDLSKRVQRLEITESTDALQIAKLNNLVDFRIWGLATNSLVSQFGKASLLFLVPRLRRQSPMLLPTYVLTASPGLTMTVLEGGALTASGSGTILLQVHEIQSEIEPFIEQLIRHAMLENWTMLLSDPHSKTLILALTGPSHPVHAVVIPLWPSDYMASSLRLDLAKIVNALGNGTIKEFVLFSPFKRHLHYFSPPGKEVLENQNLLLKVDPSGADFTLSAVYKLRKYLTNKKNQKNWGAIILTPYNIVSPPFFADGPPSTHLRRADLKPMSSTSLDILLPSNAGNENAIEDSNNVNEHLEDSVVDEKQYPHPSSGPIKSTPPRDILSLFKSWLGVFLRLFFRIFWSHIIPFGIIRNVRSPKATVDDPKIENSDDDLIAPTETRDVQLDEHAPDPPIPHQIGVQTTITTASENGDTCQDTKVSGSTLLEDMDSGTKNIVSSGASHAPDKPEAEEILYVELMYNPDDTPLGRSTAAIMVMPSSNDTFAIAVGDPIGISSAPGPGLSDGLGQAIRFLDGSSPQCTVSKIDIFFYDGWTKKGRVQGTDYCDLLQYELEWGDTRKGSVISISSPA